MTKCRKSRQQGQRDPSPLGCWLHFPDVGSVRERRCGILTAATSRRSTALISKLRRVVCKRHDCLTVRDLCRRSRRRQPLIFTHAALSESRSARARRRTPGEGSTWRNANTGLWVSGSICDSLTQPCHRPEHSSSCFLESINLNSRRTTGKGGNRISPEALQDCEPAALAFRRQCDSVCHVGHASRPSVGSRANHLRPCNVTATAFIVVAKRRNKICRSKAILFLMPREYESSFLVSSQCLRHNIIVAPTKDVNEKRDNWINGHA